MNTDDKNMKHSTAMIIEALRADGEPKLLLLAADRLEELQQKCILHYDTICELTKERNEARAEVERLKQALHDSRIENSGQAAQFERTRPELSRLEIAAMLLAAVSSRRDKIDWDANFEIRWAIGHADGLIAAAREGK